MTCCINVKENQPPPDYHCLYLSIFSFSPIKFSVPDLSALIRVRVFKFGVHLESGQVYCGTENQAAEINFAFFFSFFFFHLSLQCNTYGNLCQIFLRLLQRYKCFVLCERESASSCLFFSLFFISPKLKAHRWADSIGRHPSSAPSFVHPSLSVCRRRQHLQMTSPLKPLSRFLPYFTYRIYRQEERISLFFIPIG